MNQNQIVTSAEGPTRVFIYFKGFTLRLIVRLRKECVDLKPSADGCMSSVGIRKEEKKLIFTSEHKNFKGGSLKFLLLFVIIVTEKHYEQV